MPHHKPARDPPSPKHEMHPVPISFTASISTAWNPLSFLSYHLLFSIFLRHCLSSDHQATDPLLCSYFFPLCIDNISAILWHASHTFTPMLLSSPSETMWGPFPRLLLQLGKLGSHFSGLSYNQERLYEAPRLRRHQGKTAGESLHKFSVFLIMGNSWHFLLLSPGTWMWHLGLQKVSRQHEGKAQSITELIVCPSGALEQYLQPPICRLKRWEKSTLAL